MMTRVFTSSGEKVYHHWIPELVLNKKRGDKQNIVDTNVVWEFKPSTQYKKIECI